jgi:acetylornithine deacetylase/succinyl-diaminopimelate desuccinylase-like protein
VESDPDAQMRESHGKLIKLQWESGYPALRSDIDSREAKAVIAAASKAAGYPVVIMPMVGGSVPLYIFDETFHSPIICMGIANHDNNQHAANENLRLKNLWDGIDAYAALISDLHF